ncbi:MAG: acyltransferase [Glaciimonas sp.]|nr:acyltransferase [Glaciimonas sp.]
MEMSASRSKRIFGLDFLRAAAISLVFLAHSEIFLHTLGISSTLFHYAGFQGVEIFFALSGFLIGSILMKGNITSPQELFRFYSRRWMRTFPAFYTAFILLYFFYKPDLYSALSVGSFTANLTPSNSHDGLPFFGVSWSLAIEEWFYLLLGIALLTFGCNARVVFCLWLVALSSRLAFLATTNQATYDIAHTTVFLRLDALMVGVFAASARLHYSQMSSKLLGMLRFVYACGLAVGLAVWIGYPWIQYNSKIFSAVFLPLNSVFLALFILDFSSTPKFLDRLSRKIFEIPKKSITFLSAISYSLYLYHLELIRFSNNFSQLNEINRFLIAASLSILAAYFSYILIEKPFLSLRDNAFTPNKQDRLRQWYNAFRRGAVFQCNREILMIEKIKIKNKK